MEEQAIQIQPLEESASVRVRAMLHVILLLIASYCFITAIWFLADNVYPALMLIATASLFVITLGFGLLHCRRICICM